MNRTAVTYNEILGRTEHGAVIVLDNTFSYNDGGLRGAVGTSFEIVSASEVQSRLAGFEDYADELWREAVREEETTDGLTEWIEGTWPTDEDKIEFMFDNSYEPMHDVIREAFDVDEDAVIHCIGGGRMFPEALDGLEWLPGKQEKFEPIILEAEGQ